MITITSLWIAALALLLFFLARRVRTVQRTLRCPIRGTDALVSCLEAEPEGRPIGVIACSEFSPATAMMCDRRCLRLLGGPTAVAGGGAEAEPSRRSTFGGARSEIGAVAAR